MIVGRSNFQEVVEKLSAHTRLSLDTETTGLRPFHGDRLFSIIIACSPTEAYYFNFQAYPGLDAEKVLLPLHLSQLVDLTGLSSITWYMHNARFDLHMLAQEGLEIAGDVHCTQAGAVLEDNTHLSYSLESCAERIGEKKDDAVENYIEANHLWDWIEIPGKKTRKKNKYFYKVPFDVISPYGERDATVTFGIGQRQEKTFEGLDAKLPPSLPHLSVLHQNEKRLTRTVVRMEQVGIKIDREYCVRACQHEAGRAADAADEYRLLAGRDFKDSTKEFSAVFGGEKDKWGFTEKGNPSFESDILKTFEHPAATQVLIHRDAKSKQDFYQGYLYHADARDIVHPHWNPAGAPATGRFSSSEPNFQNLTSEDWGRCGSCAKSFEGVTVRCSACGSDKICQSEFLVRRALIPRDGYVFLLPDFDQMEYRMMFDYACQAIGHETDLVKRIKAGHDPHQAMADTVTATGRPLTRSKAKNANFAKLYGSGPDTFAKTAGCTVQDGIAIMRAIDVAAPEVGLLVGQVIKTAKVRGYIFSWTGRRYQFPDPRWAYKAPNYLIQGGSADVVKIAMNRIDQMLIDKRFDASLVGTIHDELPLEVIAHQAKEVAYEVKAIMEGVFPWKYLPLTVGMEYAAHSLADKIKGYP